MTEKEIFTTKNQNSINNLLLGLAVFVLFLAALQPVKAQDIYSTISAANQSLWREQSIYNQIIKQGEAVASDSNGSTTATSNAGTVFQQRLPQYPITTTDFTPSSTRLMPDQFANSNPNLTSEQKEELRITFYRFLTNYEKSVRKNNLAYSMAFAVSVSLQVISGKQVSDRDFGLIVNYYNSSLGNIPQFRNYTDQQKQVLYESSIITGGIIAVLSAQKDPARQSQAREMAKAILRTFAGINVA